jgi:hypothetical protein
MRRQKALGAALVLLGVLVAIAVMASAVFVKRARDAEFIDLASTELARPSAAPAAGVQPGLAGAPKSLAVTKTAETSSTEASSAVSPTSQPAGDSASDAGQQGSDAADAQGPGTATEPSAPRGEEPGAPGSPGTRTSTVSGRVYHEVWGMPLADIRVRLSPDPRTTSTDAAGTFAFTGVPDNRLVLVTVDEDGWLSHGVAMSAFITPGTSALAYGVYQSSESSGRDWRDAASWRNAPTGEIEAAVARVSAASSVFRGISLSQASSVLAWSRKGTPEQRARAELLATWLDLATTRLGFDTRVSLSQVTGAGSALPTSTTVLSLVRNIEAYVTSGGRVDWNLLRRVLSSRVLST